MVVFGFVPRFSFFGKPDYHPRFPRGTSRHPKIIRERSTTLPALSVFADRHGKVQYPLWFHDVPPGWCPEAFARQHVSMADNRQNDTRPIQPSQPPMTSQIHPESHRPIADSPDQLAHSPKPPATPPSQWQERSAAQYDFRPVGQFPFAHAHSRQDRLSPRWHGGGRPCDQCGEATEQFQVIVLVKQIAKITDGLVHVLVSAPIVPGTIAALVMRAQVAVEHQSVEDAVQPLDGDAPRPVVRVRIQTGETFGDRQSDGRGLDLEEPYRLAERKMVGQHPQRDLAVVVFHAMADIRLAAIVAPVARVAVQLKYPLEDLVDQRHGARTALRSRRVTWTPAGPGVFPGTRPSPSDRRPVRRAPARASVRASVWISSLWACPWASARAPPRTSGPVLAAPAFQGCDARDPVHGHDLRLGQTVLDVVARRRDLRLPHVYRIVRNAFIPVLIFRMNHIHRWIMKTRSLGHRYPFYPYLAYVWQIHPGKAYLGGMRTAVMTT